MTALEAGRIPLALYVHLPWCLRKCPYCDFNSHAVRESLNEQAYVQALLDDLRSQTDRAGGRRIGSIFIGGGTPSLFSGAAIGELLRGVAACLPLADDVEITLEANPGTADAAHFAAYRRAGVNRLSIGVQSLNNEHLQALGRIHDAELARQAFDMARAAGFDNINLDLMFGLPQQTEAQALEDLSLALEWAPEHLSWYQLTIEPNTLFYSQPPAVPEDDVLWAMQRQGQTLLEQAGYAQYEISAYARPGRQCRHNLNYWRFGDYLGIGAGAHGKWTSTGTIRRYHKPRHPNDYQRHPQQDKSHRLSRADIVLESMMNVLRLRQGIELPALWRHTGLSQKDFEPGWSQGCQSGLLRVEHGRVYPSGRGRAFLNELLELFYA